MVTRSAPFLNPKSSVERFGDVGSRAGGEPYEILEEPALSGLSFGSIFGVGRSKAVHAHLFDYDYSDRREAWPHLTGNEESYWHA